ncbi:ROK family transcriptional regulator [Rhizobium sp. PAMB 3182]
MPMVPNAAERPVARKISINAVMRTILEHGPQSRTSIAKLTGLSKQTISDVVRDLEDDGWLTPVGHIEAKAGRNALSYEINHRAAFAVGMDIGGTKIAAAITDLSGNILAETVVPTDKRGGEHLVAQLENVVTDLMAEADAPRSKLSIAVLGTPGFQQPGTGHIEIAPNIPGLDAIDLRGLLSARLGIPVEIENDVNLAACGEQWRGHGMQVDNFAFVAFGTGIGMGLIANGKLVRGARGGAGEIAYLPIGADPYDSRGFLLGTLETSIGSVAIAERYHGFGGKEGHTVRDIFSALQDGEQAAIATLEETARIAASALAAIGAILDPQLIVLGGSIGSRQELLDAIRRHLPRCTPLPLRLELSQFGSRAALMGAVGVATNRMHETLFGVEIQLPG